MQGASSTTSSSRRRRIAILLVMMSWTWKSPIWVVATVAAATTSPSEGSRGTGSSWGRSSFQVHYQQVSRKTCCRTSSTRKSGLTRRPLRLPPPSRLEYHSSCSTKLSTSRCPTRSHLGAASKQIGDDDDDDDVDINSHHLAEIDKLLKKMGHSLYSHDKDNDASQPLFQVERISGKGAFCNSLYKVTPISLTASSASKLSTATTWVVKIFSPLALERMDPTRSFLEQQQDGQKDSNDSNDCGSNNRIDHHPPNMVVIDRLAAEQNLAPTIFATSATGILMEHLDGRVLAEADVDGSIHNDDDDNQVNNDYASEYTSRLAASAIAKLHQLQGPIFRNNDKELLLLQSRPQSPHMLWRACHVMLQKASATTSSTTSTCSLPSWQEPSSRFNDSVTSPRFWQDYNMEGWSLERLSETVHLHQQELEANDKLLLTWTGHGDCKPCNLILLAENNRLRGAASTTTNSRTMDIPTASPPTSCIKFIDLELAGLQYVAYDLAKFWRRRRTNAHTEDPLASSTLATRRNRRAFLQTYVEEATMKPTASSSGSNSPMPQQRSSGNMSHQRVGIQDLEWQMKLLLPLTWLEAALFFACMANTTIGIDSAAAVASSNASRNGIPLPYSPSRTSNDVDQWMNLAMDRIKSYEQCIAKGPAI
jgi:thiamine kinase-like enzyme